MGVVHSLEVDSLLVAFEIGVSDQFFDSCKTQIKRQFDAREISVNVPSSSFLRTLASWSLASSIVEIYAWMSGSKRTSSGRVKEIQAEFGHACHVTEVSHHGGWPLGNGLLTTSRLCSQPPPS